MIVLFYGATTSYSVSHVFIETLEQSCEAETSYPCFTDVGTEAQADKDLSKVSQVVRN